MSRTLPKERQKAGAAVQEEARNGLVPGTAKTFVTRQAEIEKEYIEKLPGGLEQLQKRVQSFRGLLLAVYKGMFDIRLYPDAIKYNRKTTIIDLDDPEMIEAVFEMYVELCAKYSYAPTILDFSMYSGIGREMIQMWKEGRMRQQSPAHMDLAIKIYETCEGALYATAASMQGNPAGPIFLLKSHYQYQDGNNRIEIVTPDHATESPEEIAARHVAASLPQRPDDI